MEYANTIALQNHLLDFKWNIKFDIRFNSPNINKKIAKGIFEKFLNLKDANWKNINRYAIFGIERTQSGLVHIHSVLYTGIETQYDKTFMSERYRRLYSNQITQFNMFWNEHNVGNKNLSNNTSSNFVHSPFEYEKGAISYLLKEDDYDILYVTSKCKRIRKYGINDKTAGERLVTD